MLKDYDLCSISPAGYVEFFYENENLELSPIWLRDHCEDSKSVDTTSGQKLFSISEIPDDLAVLSANVSKNKLNIEFSDGYKSYITISKIIDHSHFNYDDYRSEKGKILWDHFHGSFKKISWSDYLQNKTPVLKQVAEVGFSVLSNVPNIENMVIKVGETFGYIRETNYGSIFDVRVEENAINLAFTDKAISAHTDNPYRDPVPTIQILHCLQNNADGGESSLVDGFAAAAKLRTENPEAFEILTKTQVTFVFDSKDSHLASTKSIINLDSAGRICEIRFNNRSIKVPIMSVKEQIDFYNAFSLFSRILNNPEASVSFKMEPGDCIIFDNTRILHARSAFGSSGARHLQGAYADLDGLLSTLQVLERK